MFRNYCNRISLHYWMNTPFPRHQSIQSSNQSYRNTQTITDTYSNKNNFIRTTGLSKAADFALN